MTDRPAALALEGVGFSYRPRGRNPIEALAAIDLVAGTGTTTAIVGPNGCGKTTLLRIACGLLAPDTGTVRGEPGALMPQQDLLLPWAGALDNAALALRAGGMSRNSARGTAAEWFARLGLEGFEEALPHELSGGMRQRVAFARTLLAGRGTLALDEPFAALDALSRLEARQWLRAAIGESGRTALLVTHDVDEAISVASSIVVLTARPARTAGVHSVAEAARRDPVAALALRESILTSLAVGA